MHVKGYAAPETKAAVERARLLIETADALGEHPQDPLLSFSVLYGYWVVNYVAFNGDVMLALARQFLERAKGQGASGPLMTGHRLMGTSLLYAGQFEDARVHLDRAIQLLIPPSIAHWQRDLARTREWLLYSTARAPCGPLLS
jgi:hypothetical protein